MKEARTDYLPGVPGDGDAGGTMPPPARALRRGPAWLGLAVGVSGLLAIGVLSRIGLTATAAYVLVILLMAELAGRRGLYLAAAGCVALALFDLVVTRAATGPDGVTWHVPLTFLCIALATGLAAWRQNRSCVTAWEQDRYRHIFDRTGIAIWEQDLSAVRRLLQADEKGTALQARLREQPELVENYVRRVRILDANAAAIRLMRARSRAEVLQSLGAFFTEETWATFADFLVAISENRPSFLSETTIRTATGERRHVIVDVTFPRQSEAFGSVLIGLVDVTDRVRAERALEQARAELAQVARAATLGAFTTSIAHEVNQPLTGVVTNGEAALRWLSREAPDLPEAVSCLTMVVSEGQRAAQIVQRIRRMTTRTAPDYVVLDLNAVVGEALALLRRELSGNGVTLTLDLARAPLPVMADRIELQQVLINLAINAIQAMQGQQSRPLLIRSEQVGATACLRVEDRGPGLSGDALRHLFDPFYTTKPGGTGIGLSICRSIVEACDGSLRAEAREGGGAVFTVVLPLARTAG
ncbi:sensor histidine kinase [Roseomonas elaeocarpi]|uniref:histidine kinase n=1 Tax=Roseomonas elaeocarpi TaxID=907779 RepID=A0ABV6JYX1_9PROT